MVKIIEDSISPLKPMITILLENNVLCSDDLVGIIFYEGIQYRIFEVPPEKAVIIDLYKDLNIINAINILTI
ncbi:hypothetical protein L1765_12320 [Microaerobacter geothermalis]|uniref:hypothetical protein n=1 Tax=Microaerobacter geothermalis TaxID=674972 RepID=UPI001F20BA32|nr:hypothetical protein [Microaerobacter geothermalis]MCF6094746.1 hypothetical protein [Microaerobacter geothermalis]